MLVNLNDILYKAQQEKYAVGLFNTTDTDMLEAAIGAAEELRSPIIIGTAEVLLPYGELKLIAPSVVEAAKRASVPVVVQYDHGLTFDRCIEALKLGFSSIMFDASAKDYENNIAQTREIVKIAHSFGATVEGEIGHVGEAAESDNTNADMYTKPNEARDFISATGIDACAVSVGTAHGAYIKTPKLDFDRLKDIHSAVETPLVLHGGSGLSDDDFKKSVKCGISKVNIFTDLCIAGACASERAIKENKGYLEMRNMKVEAIKDAVKKKIRLFGSEGKA